MELIKDMLAQGASRDAIIIELHMKSGLTLNAATKAYADYARENGLTAVATSYKEDALEYLADTHPVSHWDVEAVRESIAHIQSEYGVAESTARDYTKAYSESLGVAHPTENPRELIFAWCKENVPHMSQDEARKALKKYIVEDMGRSSSNANEYVKGLDLYYHLVG